MKFIKMLTSAAEDISENVKGLLNMLSEKFKPQLSDTVLPLKCCKLRRDAGESKEEGIGKKSNRVKVQRNLRLTKQFINGINNHTMIAEIIKELTVLTLMMPSSNFVEICDYPYWFINSR